MWWQFAVDFLFPPGCVHCGRDFAVDGCQSSVEGLCCNCLDCLSDADQPVCYRCAAPVGPNVATHEGCGLCSHESFAFERAFALGVYGDALRKACLATKGAFSAPLAAAPIRWWILMLLPPAAFNSAPGTGEIWSWAPPSVLIKLRLPVPARLTMIYRLPTRELVNNRVP